ncbi:hypothetical protein I317_05093 [Kwoniella heveanensis CBS 569]|uniref:Uncharacterized protein n=1 Tax=Kwoniella heveanensis BCC8398 TaxID=1296120 RepID=A0A1B9GXT3_9TREE|nr:hypothetical protein I316_02334 [Kwoniella heveanensis BCC8398]OCF41082.1 hypothetical protein I317_05093 [Kwoniella heveanensis CBS 569]
MSMSKSMDSKRDRPTPTPTPKEYPISPSPGAARRSQATTTTTTAAEEIPIDPALLEGQADVVGAETDMDDMEDAEGELVDDELDFMLHSSEVSS